jgi:hypothetical protein
MPVASIQDNNKIFHIISLLDVKHFGAHAEIVSEPVAELPT